MDQLLILNCILFIFLLIIVINRKCNEPPETQKEIKRRNIEPKNSATKFTYIGG